MFPRPIHSFLFLGCNTPWVRALACALASDCRVEAIANSVWSLLRQVPHSNGGFLPTKNLGWREWRLPAGYAGIFSKAFTPLLAQRVATVASRMFKQNGQPPIIFVPYPYIEPWLAKVPWCPVVYYNLDDYRLYEPHKAKRVVQLEARLLSRSRLVLCLSKTQLDHFTSVSPFPDRVVHFPLGVVDHFIRRPDEAEGLIGAVVYIGNMEDRVDWRYVLEVAHRCPALTFYFVGYLNPDSNPSLPWQDDRRAVRSVKNIVFIGGIPQDQITSWSLKASVNWIPYKTDHPFNIACCPTKIMDYIASGRPILSTSVPECALYPDWITIRDDYSDCADWLNSTAGVRVPCNPAQIAFAAMNTWKHRALELLSLLNTKL